MKNNSSYNKPSIAIPLLRKMQKFEVPLRPETKEVEIITSSWIVKLCINLGFIKVENRSVLPRDIWERAYRTGYMDNRTVVQNYFLRKQKKIKFCHFHKKRVGNCRCLYQLT